MRYKQICALIVLPLFSSAVSAFGFEFFSPGFPHRAGSFSVVSFSGDSPALVDVKLAVQDNDGNLHVVNTLHNIRTSGQTAMVDFPPGSEPGINYWLVAVEPSNSQNYATLGPFTVTDRMNSASPSTSVSANSEEVYQTTAPINPSPTSVIRPSGTGANNWPTATPTRTTDGNRSTTNGARSSSSPGSHDEDDDGTTDKSLGTGAIIGISVGGAAGAVILVLVIYHCLFRKTAAPLGTLPLATNPSNNNASSIQPITKDEYSPSVTPSAPITTPPMTNNSNVNQQPSPVVQNQQPSSSVPLQNSHSCSYNVEQTYNYRPADNNPYQQQHLFNNNVGQYSTAPYPSHDSMPMPEHASYQSPAMQYPQQQQQQQNWSPYGQQQTAESQTLFSSYPSPTLVAVAAANNGSECSKTETTIEPTYSQKFEYENVASDKIENSSYHQHQKPDSPFYTQKPDDSFESAQQHSKPHEKN